MLKIEGYPHLVKSKDGWVGKISKGNPIPLHYVLENMGMNRLVLSREVGEKNRLFNSFLNVNSFLKIKYRDFYHFYEVLQGPVKEVYDIDGKRSEIQRSDEEILELFLENRTKYLISKGYNFIDQTHCVKTSSTSEKISLHIIFNNGYHFENLTDQKEWMEGFNMYLEAYKSPIKFDTSIYNTNHCLRCLGSVKFINKDNPERYCRKMVGYEHIVDEEFYVTNISENSRIINVIKPAIPKAPRVLQTTIKDTISKDTTLVASFKERVKEWCSDNFEMVEDNIGYILVRKKPSYCEIHKREHSSIDNYAFVKKGVIYIGCYRGGNDYLQIGKIPRKSGNLIAEEKLDQLLVLNKDCNVINIDKKYVDFNDLDWSGKQCLAIKAPMGSGKTTAIINFLRTIPKDKRIVLVSPRMSFSRERTAEYNRQLDYPFAIYLDFRKNLLVFAENHKRVVIQIESIWCLRYIIEEIDIVILDEIEAILRQHISVETNKERMYDNIMVFKGILRNAKKIIVADAFLSNISLNFLKDLNIETRVYIYTTLPDARLEYPCAKYSEFVGKLMESLRLGKKVYAVYSSITKLEKIVEYVRLNEPTKKVLVYSSKKRYDLSNINEEWQQYDLVINTTAITVGINFDVPSYFDRVFIYFSSASRNNIADIFQSHYRVRSVVDNMLIYHIDTRRFASVSTNEKVIEREYNETEDYVMKIKPNFLLAPRHIRNLARDVTLFNNLSYANSEVCFKRWLKECNYESDTKDTFDYAYNEVSKDKVPYDEIPTISSGEMTKLYERYKSGDNLSEIERLSMDKYLFLLNFDQAKLVGEIGRDIWDNYDISRLSNIRYEYQMNKGTLTKDKLLDKSCKSSIAMFDDGTIKKYEIVKWICESLNIPSSYEVGSNIARDDISRIANMLQTRYGDILKIFELKNRKKADTFDVKSSIDLLNNVLSKWSCTKIISTGRRRRRIDGRTVDISNFCLGTSIENGVTSPNDLVNLFY